VYLFSVKKNKLLKWLIVTLVVLLIGVFAGQHYLQQIKYELSADKSHLNQPRWKLTSERQRSILHQLTGSYPSSTAVFRDRITDFQAGSAQRESFDWLGQSTAKQSVRLEKSELNKLLTPSPYGHLGRTT
jgi:hypothetical protein